MTTRTALGGLSVALLAASLAACGSDSGTDDSDGDPRVEGGAGGGPMVPDVPEFDGDCTKVAVAPTFAQLSAGIFARCTTCHSTKLAGPARNDAPEMVNFDTYDGAKAAAFQAVAAVKQRIMPFPDGDGVGNAERNQLYEWALCGMAP